MKKLDIKSSPIRSLFLFYLVSAIITNIIRTVHSIIDGIFISNGVEDIALAAINITLPITIVFSSIALLFGSGGAVNSAIESGKGNYKKANSIFISSILTMLILVVIFQGIYYIMYEKIFHIIGVDNSLFDYTKSYANTLVIFMPCMALNIAISTFVRNDENPKLVTITQILCTLFNIILNAIFIFVLDLELFGAALATGIAQTFAVLILLSHFILKKGMLRISFKKIKYNFKDIKQIIKLGLPTGMSEIAYAIVILVINIVIMGINGSVGLSAFSISFNVSNMAFAIFTGVAQAIQPIVSFNFGAMLSDRVKQSLKVAYTSCFVIGSAMSIIIFIFAENIVNMYGPENIEIIELSTTAIKLLSIVYLVVIFNIIVTGYLQAVGSGRDSLIIQIMRGFALTIVLVLVLPNYIGFTGIMLAFPLAEVLTLPLSIIFLRKNNKNILK